MTARSPRSLMERRITHIVSVCTDAIPAELPQSGMSHLRIAVEDVDYEDLLIRLPSACRFIEHAIENGGNVLVHCVQGISRSAAVVAAYCKLKFLIKVNLPINIIYFSSDVETPHKRHKGPGYDQNKYVIYLFSFLLLRN